MVIALGAVPLFAAETAAAAERWAAPTGSGTACTEATPCSLNTAVEDAAVLDGDEVIVKPGDYTITDLTISSDISVHGQALQPVPEITGGVFGITVNADATVSDLRIEATSLPLQLSFGADGAVVQRVYSQATGGGGNACSILASATLRDSVCWASGTNSKGAGANLSGGSPETITLRNVTAVGAAFGLAFNYNGSASTTTIDAVNVIAEGGAGSGQADVHGSADSGGSTQIVLAHSNYATELEVGTTGGTTTITDPGSGTNQTAAPLFVNAGTGDFHQQATSPTIDAGDDDASIGLFDFEGDDRALDGDGVCPIDAEPDIGADELDPGTLDCDPPETGITGPTGTTGPTPTFTLTSDEPGSEFECKIDGGPFAACSSPYTTPPLTSGPHTLQAQATDPAGNTDSTPASQTFTVDAQPPETSISGGPSGVTGDRTPTFNLASTEPGSTFQCRIDGGAYGTCPTPFTTPPLSDGRHTLFARSTDQAGNADPTPATRTFRIDATAPDTTITAAPKALMKTKRKRAKVSLSFAASEPGRFECSLDGADFGPCTSPQTAKVGKGAHVWTVRAIDQAGNADGTPAEAKFKVKRKRKRR